IGMELLIYDKNYLPYNIILLAKRFEGYKNLCKISSFVNLKYKNEKKCVYVEDIRNICSDIICIIGYENNLLANHLMKNNSKEAEKVLKKWSDTFKEDLFFEIIRKNNNGLKNNYADVVSEKYREDIVKSFAEKKDIGIVAANNVSFLSKEDY